MSEFATDQGTFGRVIKLRETLQWAFLVALFGGLLCANGAGANDQSSLAGTYRDEQVTVTLDPPTDSGRAALYTGTVQVDARKFPLHAEAQEQSLKGTFETEGTKFEFTGQVVGQMLVFTSGGTTYRLRKQVVNPLARLSKTNPLAQPNRTNLNSARAAPTAPTNRPGPVVHPPTQPEVVASLATVRLKRRSVLDDTNMIGGEAFSLLMPLHWQLAGGMMWRAYRSAPALISMRVADPQGTTAWEVYPSIPFVWADEPDSAYPPGSSYLGNEVAAPIHDPVVYVRRVILPRFQRNISQPLVTQTEELPRLAEVVQANAQEPGVQKTCRAIRVRLDFTEAGRKMEEDIYCVLTYAYAPVVKTTLWGAERSYCFKAEKGKLDGTTALFQTMVDSVKVNIHWFNRYVQLVQLLLQNPPDSLRYVTDLPIYLARTTDQVSEPVRQLYERQQAAEDQVRAAFKRDQLALFRNPFDSGTIELPAIYREAWASSLGDYLLSNDPAARQQLPPEAAWEPLARTP